MIHRGRDRAQLMLVGAVAIALILMGLVVVFNTVLFTDTKTASNTLEESSEAQSFQNQIRKETQRLSAWLNESQNFTQFGDPEFQDKWNESGSVEFYEELNRSVANWSRLQGLSHAQTGPVLVSLRLQGCPGDSGEPGCNMTRSPDARIEIRWGASGFSYNTTMLVDLSENPTAAPAVRAPAARGREVTAP